MTIESVAARNNLPRMAENEAFDVDFFEADEEEEDEDAEAVDDLGLDSSFDESGYGTQDDASCGVGDDGVESEPLEDAFKEFGADD